jgi:hypothetical protein
VSTPTGGDRPARIALVVDDTAAEHWDDVVGIAERMIAAGAHVDIWSHPADRCRRERVRQAGTAWHGLPPASMTGSPASRRYLSRLLTGLTASRPDVVVGIGAAAGVACGLAWRTAGAGCGIWYQPDARPLQVSPRVLRLAAGWVSEAWTANRQSARLLTETFGVEATRVVVLGAADLGGEFARRTAERARAGGAAASRERFAPALIQRAVFQHVLEQERQATLLANQLRRSDARSVLVCGSGHAAQMLAAACRRRRLRVVSVVPAAGSDGGPAERRRTLAEAFRRGARAVAFASLQEAFGAVRRVRQVARACGVKVAVVAVGQPGFTLRPPAGCQSAESRALAARRRRGIERSIRPLVAALRDEGVRECCIYGASEVGRVLLRIARRRRIRVRFFVDGNDARWGEVLEGVEIVSLADVVSRGPHVFAIGSLAHAATISDTITAAYRSSPARIFAPDA